MASKHCATRLRFAGLMTRWQRIQDLSNDTSLRICRRTLATVVEHPTASYTSAPQPSSSLPSARINDAGLIIPSQIPSHIVPTQEVLTTVYSFPTLQPLTYDLYPHTHLAVPLRRDILHKAVVFEGDSSRQGTANTKWRSEVHASGRKIRPQKGTGHARLGDRKSPMLRGGGVAHGPKPRDFATKLPRKMYDRAWRMALSYRWRRGELVVVDSLDASLAEISAVEDSPYYLKWALDGLGWGHGPQSKGHSFFITESPEGSFKDALEQCERYGRLRSCDEVDVKNLLEMKRLVVERGALRRMLKHHQSDLVMPLLKTPAQVAEAAARRAEALELARTGKADIEHLLSTGSIGTNMAAAAAVASSGLEAEEVDEIEIEDEESNEQLSDEEIELLIDEQEKQDAREAKERVELWPSSR